MAITLSSSQYAAAQQAAAEPIVTVELQTPHGVWRFAREDMTWAGQQWHSGLLGDLTLRSGVSGADAGLAPVKRLSFALSDREGVFARQSPFFLRARTLIAREGFRDVSSEHLRQDFRVAGMSYGRGKVTIDAEDIAAGARRVQVPSDRVLIDETKFPDIHNNARAIGGPIPLIYGRVLTPLQLVDETGNDTVWVACVGSAELTGDILEDYHGELIAVSGTLRVVDVSGMPVTQILRDHQIRDSGAGEPLAHYADLTSPLGGDVTPDKVLIDLMTNTWAGAGLQTTDINSDALALANSFYQAASLSFDCALTTQRPLEAWLGDWVHDSMTQLVLRDQWHLVPQQSRSAQASFYPANIVRNSLSYRDATIGQEGSRRRVEYRERSRAPSPRALESWDAGSGAQVVRQAPFIGRRSVAARVAQYWAKRAAGTVREYEWRTTVKAAGLEEGDLVTLTHSLVGAQGQLCEVTRIERREGTYAIKAQEISTAVFAAESIPSDRAFIRRAVLVRFTNSYADLPGQTYSFTTSHALSPPGYAAQTPTTAITVGGPKAIYMPSSLVSANNSEMNVAIFIGTTNEGTSANVQLDDEIAGWEARTKAGT